MTPRPMDEFDFRLKEDDERLVLMGRQLLRRALQDARIELQKRHLEAKNKGEIISLVPDRQTAAELLHKATKKAINPRVQD